MRWNWGSEVVTFVNVVIVVVVVQQAYDVVVTDDVVVVVVVEHHHRKVDWAGVTKSHQPLNGNNRLSEPPNQTPNVFLRNCRDSQKCHENNSCLMRKNAEKSPRIETEQQKRACFVRTVVRGNETDGPRERGEASSLGAAMAAILLLKTRPANETTPAKQSKAEQSRAKFSKTKKTNLEARRKMA